MKIVQVRVIRVNKKKVWIINHYATPPSFGGLNRHHYLAKKINDKYDVTVIASSAIHNSNVNMIEGKEKCLNKKIDGVNYLYIKTCQYHNKVKRIFNMLQFFFRGKKCLKKMDKPDIIYTSIPQPLSALLAIKIAKKYHIELIVETRDLWPETIICFGLIRRTGLIAKIMYQLEKYIYLHADKLVFTMEGGKEYLKERKYANKIDFSKVYHLNNGADLEKIKNDYQNYKIESKDLEDKNTFKVVYTGSIRFAYKLDIIVELARMVQNNNYDKIRFLIYGEGPYKDELIKKCEEEKINNIKFEGFVDAKYIPYILDKCDLALLHGQNHDVFKYGTSQNKMFTYLASGKPIISTFPNKYDLIEKNKCGKTVNPDNLEEYYEKIIYFYNLSKNEYKKYCENSRKLANDYDYASLGNKLIKIIEEK